MLVAICLTKFFFTLNPLTDTIYVMGKANTLTRQQEILDMKRRMKSGENISADELKSYSAEDMMKGRFDRAQELVNQTKLYEQEIARHRGLGNNEQAFDLQNKLNQIRSSNPDLKPNNNSFYDPYGNLNPANEAVSRGMEIAGTAEPRLGPSRRVWNLGEYNNTIAGEGGYATGPALAEIAMIEGARHAVSIPSLNEGEDQQMAAINALNKKKYLESLK